MNFNSTQCFIPTKNFGITLFHVLLVRFFTRNRIIKTLLVHLTTVTNPLTQPFYIIPIVSYIKNRFTI